MKMLCLSLLILYFFRLEFVFRLDFFVDFYCKSASFSVRLFFLKIVSGNISYEEQDGNKKLILSMGKKKREINAIKEGRKNAASIKHIIDFVEITELRLDAKIGDRDAFRAAMLMGSIKTIYYSLVSMLKSKQRFLSHESFVPFVNEEILTLDLYCILNISFADIIFSWFLHKMDRLTKKLDKEIEL